MLSKKMPMKRKQSEIGARIKRSQVEGYERYDLFDVDEAP